MKPSLILGIDPGLHGAIALLDPLKLKVLEVIDTPLVYRNGKNEIDVYELGLWLDFRVEHIDFAVIEDVGVMTGQEGRVSMFNFGKNTGIIHGALGTLGIPMYLVKPAVWKSLMGLSRDKEASRALATKTFPSARDFWPLKKHDGRAEAALLALFGAERFRG